MEFHWLMHVVEDEEVGPQGGDFLRALRRCAAADGTRSYVLNSVACPSGSNLDAVLGYVR